MVPSAVAGGLAALAVLLPLAWKWRLPLRVVIVWAAVTGVVLGAALSLALGGGLSITWLALHVCLVLATSLAAAATAFFRDPERVPPADPHAVVSPADGEVLYVRAFGPGEYPPIVKHGLPVEARELSGRPEGGQVIGIGMHLLNVHVNRAPVRGTVAEIRHVHGAFLSLRRPEAVSLNERTTTVIENEHATVAVVQIASRLVRRIVSYLEEGSAVSAGQRIGMIRFGSQVDLVLPHAQAASVSARVGDTVRAGETVIARLEERAASGDADAVEVRC